VADPLADVPNLDDAPGMCEDPDAGVAESPGPNAEGEDPGLFIRDGQVAGEFPVGQFFGINFGANFKERNGAFVKGFARVPGLPSATFPLCFLVYMDLKPSIKGAFQATYTDTGWDLILDVAATCTATIRGGMPNVASVGAGVELEGKANMTLQSKGSEWTGSPPVIALSGSPVLDLGIGRDTPIKAKVGRVELVKLKPTANGYVAEAGAGLQALKTFLFGENDKAAYVGWDNCGTSEGGTPDGASGADGGYTAPCSALDEQGYIKEE
jgi:hypothetical protein